MLALVLATDVTPARADRISDLTEVLQNDKDDKARIAAAVGLGRLADPRGVPALIRALRDRSPVVRGVAASALGHIGDARAIPALEKLLSDGSDAVRARARDALAGIREKQARASGGGRPVKTSYVAPKERPLLKPPAPTPRLHVMVKSTANRTDTGGKPFGERLRTFLVAELVGTPEITLDASLAGTEKLSTFIIDGAIVTMATTKSTKWVELRCEVQISISNSNGKILSIVTGGATLTVARASWKASNEKALWGQALENAVRGAHQNLVAYMTQQVAAR